MAHYSWRCFLFIRVGVRHILWAAKNSVEKQSSSTKRIQSMKTQSGRWTNKPGILIKPTIAMKAINVRVPHSISLFPGFCLNVRQKKAR